MGSLLVVTGPPGAGKSTVARIVADMKDRSVLVDGDAFFGFLRNGAIEPWKPESRAQNTTVIEAAAAAAGRFSHDCFVTVYDGVVGPWFLGTFARATGLTALDYVVLMTSVEQCVERVATRAGHGFTDEPATRKMYGEFAAADVAARHVVVDPPDQAETVAALVLRLQATGSLRYTAGRRS